ncbi:MAG: outer membrane beta-barrel protein [Flavobacteriales bacterium]|nr:outer membrane beta-barrel protein [Flavobacteriales bacterium]
MMLLFSFITPVMAQETYSVSGTVIDKISGTPLPGANILLVHARDSSIRKGTITDGNGKFTIENVRRGRYILKASFIGYATLVKDSVFTFSDVNVGTLALDVASTELSDVTVEERIVRVEIKGDTTQFNAAAYKVNPDATAEDLVKKMPGVTQENGTMKVNGEDVKRVLVNGRPYFGDDPNAALKNLPANMVDKVQVFDQQSDQAAFTGFNDGSGTRTINIITNQAIGDGSFGKYYAAAGSNEEMEDLLYNAGFSLNYFKGNRKLSFVGMSNNINQQNFSTEDLLGINSSSSGGGGGRGGPGGGRGGPGGGYGGYGQSSNFLSGNQNGVATTHSLGINFTNNIFKKGKFTGSYFGNYTDRLQLTELNRNFIYSSDSLLNYLENSSTTNLTWNHRVNLRLDLPLDSTSVLSWNPKGSFQQTSNDASVLGNNYRAENIVESFMQNLNGTSMEGYTFNNNITYRKRLKKKGRTISAEWTTDINNKSGNGYLNSTNRYYFSTDSLIVLDQVNDQNSTSHNEGVNITYTEPAGKFGQLQFTYNPNFTWSTAEKTTLSYDSTVSDHTILDTALTSKFATQYFAQKGGITYRYNKGDNFNYQVTLNGQYATLTSDQTYPVAFNVDKDFLSVLPTVSMYYAFNKQSNIRLNYRTSTDAPTASQLQNVIDNTNTLLLKGGNPDLVQSYTHRLFGRWMKSNVEEGTSIFWMMFGSLTQNYIGNSAFIAESDTLLNGNVLLKKGAQYNRYVNLSGNQQLRTYFSWGFPMAPLKSNANLNLGINYLRTPGMVNDQKNLASSYTYTAGFTLASNFSEKIDFSFGFNGNYAVVNNTLQTNSDNNYYIQNTTGKINWLFGKGFVFATDVTHSMYRGLEKEYNRDFVLWNAGFGYKFLKDRLLDVRIIAYDLLNQNNSINRTVTETYIEDTRNNVMNRYFQLQITYTFRNFKKQSATDQKPQGQYPGQYGGPPPHQH